MTSVLSPKSTRETPLAIAIHSRREWGFVPNVKKTDINQRLALGLAWGEGIDLTYGALNLGKEGGVESILRVLPYTFHDPCLPSTTYTLLECILPCFRHERLGGKKETSVMGAWERGAYLGLLHDLSLAPLEELTYPLLRCLPWLAAIPSNPKGPILEGFPCSVFTHIKAYTSDPGRLKRGG